jgi:hypothetical protein
VWLGAATGDGGLGRAGVYQFRDSSGHGNPWNRRGVAKIHSFTLPHTPSCFACQWMTGALTHCRPLSLTCNHRQWAKTPVVHSPRNAFHKRADSFHLAACIWRTMEVTAARVLRWLCRGLDTAGVKSLTLSFCRAATVRFPRAEKIEPHEAAERSCIDSSAVRRQRRSSSLSRRSMSRAPAVRTASKA